MKNLYGKLNNNDGKTILMALFLLLIAVVVSVVIITAASTAAHQLNDNREAQQAYLTVSSAAEFFRDEIEGRKYEHVLKKYTRQNNRYPSLSDYEHTDKPAGRFSSVLTDIAESVKENTLSDSGFVYKETVIGIDSPGITDDSFSGFDEVNVKIYIQVQSVSNDTSYYNMDITFEVSGDSKEESGYKMTLNIPITKAVSNTVGSNQIYVSGRYYWYTVDETITAVTFGSGTISKGAGQ